jgi:hypothetical protein
MSRILPVLLLSLMLYACNDDPEIERDTIAYFRAHLKPDMKFSRMQLLFGKPDNDIGSGIHIYVYDLNDGTKIYIGYTDKILSAKHVDGDRLLEDII